MSNVFEALRARVRDHYETQLAEMHGLEYSELSEAQQDRLDSVINDESQRLAEFYDRAYSAWQMDAEIVDLTE